MFPDTNLCISPCGSDRSGGIFLDNGQGASAFHTLKGYQMQNIGEITESMEDYLEMISRYIQENGYVRMSFLADKLNVRPSSASKMVGKLRDMRLVEFEKYGLITLTEKGRAVGQYLLWRHQVLNDFFLPSQPFGGRTGTGGAGRAFYDQKGRRKPGKAD